MKRAKWLLLLAVFALIAVACGGGGEETTTTGAGATTTTEAMADLSGTTVTVSGPESSDEEAGAMQDALNVFAEANGMTITYTGDRNFSDTINAQAAGGNPPDIAVFPQPGKTRDFVTQGFLLPVPDDIASYAAEQWPAGTLDSVSVDGTVYGLPDKSDLKSLVWYNTGIFDMHGYTIPETWDDLLALSDQMIADGVTPWCVGIESGAATGWPFTDWMEDLILRLQDASVYDQWVNHEIPFNDQRIIDVGTAVLDLWNKPGAVFAAGGSIAATPFGDNGTPLAAGDCAMHRQASFFAAFIPEGTTVGPGQAIDTFYFPAAKAGTHPVLTAGTYVSAFHDRPEVWAVMKYLTSADYSTERQRAQAARKGGGQSGYLSANLNQDMSVYNELEQSFIDILHEADPARYDGSDQMPAAVGSGTFWTEGTSAVNGDETIEEAFQNIENSWP